MRSHHVIYLSFGILCCFFCMAKDFIYILINRFLHNEGLDESRGATLWAVQNIIYIIKQI